MTDLLLVVPPFTSIEFPSLQVGLLRAAATHAGVSCEVLFLNRQFSEQIGEKFYTSVASLQRSLGVGDWVGAESLWIDVRPFRTIGTGKRYLSFEEYLVSEHNFSELDVRTLSKLRSVTSEFIRMLPISPPFTQSRAVMLCCAHQQTGFSLSLAKALKEEIPHIKVGLFGSAVENQTVAEGLIDSFQFLDVVINRDAPGALAAYGLDIFRAKTPDVTSSHPHFMSTQPATLRGISFSPDYGDFYECLTHDPVQTVLPWRTSIGCQWGDKAHCTFCGLIPERTQYQTKSSTDAAAELISLVSTTECLDIVCSDLLMPEGFPGELFAQLSEHDFDFTFFFEVRANQKKAVLDRLAFAGVQHVQVGIETFDSAALNKMKKGTTALLNVRMLKWCIERSICASWIYLIGFPEEDATTFGRQRQLLAHLTHLQPPIAITTVRIERGSPMHSRPESYGFVNVAPAEANFHTLPLEEQELLDVALYFDHEYSDGRNVSEQAADLIDWVREWQNSWRRDQLYYRRGPGFIKIVDLRGGGMAVTLRDWQARAFDLLDDIQTVLSLSRKLAVSEIEIENFLAELKEAGYVVSEGNRLLSVVPRVRKTFFGDELLRKRSYQTNSP